MCGLAGFLGGDVMPHVAARLDAAARSLHHRGPDAAGTWHDAEAGVGFAHTRLAIVELSAAGAQPMHSADGRFVVAYNGEIYNHRAVRAELVAAGCAVNFRGHSDTETLVEACARWGVEPAVRRCNGMFAFALWDRRERVLHLVRDRLGIKPLYWGQCNGRMLFASELKGLLALHDGRPALDAVAVGEFLRYGFVPAPRSIYTGIEKLPPGAILTLRAGSAPQLQRYWTLEEVVRQPRSAYLPQAVDEMDGLLREVVREQRVADVPLGAFLSGGIDSSLVSALMQQAGTQPARTFSIGFAEATHDESQHAAAVARHLGTVHTELRVTPAEALGVIPDLPHIYDEPFADSSQVPSLLLARLARSHVTVALTGDGGDEAFAGYNRHIMARTLIGPALRLPASWRGSLARGLDAVAPAYWNRLAGWLPSRVRPRQVPDKVQRLAAVLPCSPDQVYAQLLATWPAAAQHTRAGVARREFGDANTLASLPGLGERLQYLDSAVYLPDDGLVKVDRATMAASLECRVPLLDHRVLEAAWRLPWSMRVRGLAGKWMARKVLSRYVPPYLFNRPKSGFSIPLAAWLRDGLRDWAEGLLEPARLARSGLVDAASMRALWQDHLSGRADRHHALWNLLTFQSWHERWYH